MSSNREELVQELLDAAMISNDAFVERFKLAMKQLGISNKALSEGSGIPLSTINKVIFQKRDMRCSTLRAMVKFIKTQTTINADIVIGIIGTRSALDTLTKHQIIVKGVKVLLREYPSASIEDVIVNAIKAERDKVNGLVCATIVANLIGKFVKVPIMSVKLGENNMLDSVALLVEKIPLE